MTNRPEEIEEEKTVPVQNVTNQELGVIRRAYMDYVLECRSFHTDPLTFPRWLKDGGLVL